MFDIGFWELCLASLVGLLVIGPAKLPTVARVAGFWLGKIRHKISTAQADINQALQAEEIRQLTEKSQQDSADFLLGKQTQDQQSTTSPNKTATKTTSEDAK